MIRLFLNSEWANEALRELVSLTLVSEDAEHIFIKAVVEARRKRLLLPFALRPS